MARKVETVPCDHGGGKIGDCKICKGTGFVKVMVACNGQPRRCTHAGGEINHCNACKGSGWAGLVE
jgi:hypothetical protein